MPPKQTNTQKKAPPKQTNTQKIKALEKTCKKLTTELNKQKNKEMLVEIGKCGGTTIYENINKK